MNTEKRRRTIKQNKTKQNKTQQTHKTQHNKTKHNNTKQNNNRTATTQQQTATQQQQHRKQQRQQRKANTTYSVSACADANGLKDEADATEECGLCRSWLLVDTGVTTLLGVVAVVACAVAAESNGLLGCRLC